MKKSLVFATNNAHKLQEVQALIGHQIQLQSLVDIGCTHDIEETADTFIGNAGIKSQYVFNTYGLNCFADDSGLVVDALNGEPGVYSARYSGTRDAQQNLDLVLQKMEGQTNRTARFVSVISLLWEGKEYIFEGKVEGKLTLARSGAAGFGYDPIFMPDGYNITFAEMDLAEKNKISHRGRAIQQLVQFLKQQSS